MAGLRRLMQIGRIPLWLLLPAAGCSLSPYTVSLNNNVLYSPNAAVLAGGVADSSLQACINQVLLASEGTIATLKTLACPDAGVRSLEGISALAALEQVELSNNQIDNLSPLQPLRNLRVLSLRNNDIRNIGPLANQPLLRFVSLEGNDHIPCAQLDELQEKLGNTLNRPANCAN
jgi:Leucine-rich repeat (LRR) protein